MSGYKVLLIQPPQRHVVDVPVDLKVVRAGRYRCEPSLGLWALASAIRADLPGVDVEITDVNLEFIDRLRSGNDERVDWKDLLRGRLVDRRPDVVGISCLFATTMKYTQTISALVKECLPKTHVVVGGSQVTSLIQPFLDTETIDFAISREGERPLISLLRCLREGDSFEGIPGLSYKARNGEYHHVPTEMLPRALDEYLPFLDPSLIPFVKYAKTGRVAGLNDLNEVAIPYETSRGCPFVCTYCAAPSLWDRRLKYKSISRIERELDAIAERMDFRHVYLQDDVPFLKKDRTLEMLEVFRKRRITPHFPNSLRVNSIDEELLDAFQRAGVVRLNLAIESAMEKTLKKMKKNVDIPHARRIIDYARSNTDIIMTANILFGTPGETLEDMRDTLRELTTLRADWWYLGIVTPIPGSEIYEIAKDNNYVVGDMEHLSFGQANMSTEDFTAEEVKGLVDEANIELNFKNNVNVREGRLGRARRHFEYVLSLAPDHEAAKEALAHVGTLEHSRSVADFTDTRVSHAAV
jgi:radical SAM superfamily enzyme YgiQ (UPF0313 family)